MKTEQAEYAIHGQYQTYKDWQLRHDLERLSKVYHQLKNFNSTKLAETIYNEEQAEKVLKELDKICDEMNLRRI